jgi:hypothetical protein
MVRRGRRPSVDPAASAKYQRVAAALLKSASDLTELAAGEPSYGNAIAIVAIHAAIAYADALCIRFGGFKSAEGDHVRTVDSLKAALGDRADAAAIRRLQRVLSQKDQVSYQGAYYTVESATRLTKDAQEFAAWAEEVLRYSAAERRDSKRYKS